MPMLRATPILLLCFSVAAPASGEELVPSNHVVNGLLDRSLLLGAHRAAVHQRLDATTFGKPSGSASSAGSPPPLRFRTPPAVGSQPRPRPSLLLGRVQNDVRPRQAAAAGLPEHTIARQGGEAPGRGFAPATDYIYSGPGPRTVHRGPRATANAAPRSFDINDALLKKFEKEAQVREQLARMQATGGQGLASSPGTASAWQALAVAAPEIESDLQHKDGIVEEVHSEEDLDECLKQSSGLVVMEVTTSWCRTCRFFAPKYKRLAGTYEQVKFLKVTANENDSTNRIAKERFAITATPSFIFLRDGQVVATQKGSNIDRLQSILNTA